VNVGAFTTPNASLLELRHARLAGLSTAGLTQDHPPVLVVQHSTFDQSLKFWKKDSEDVQNTNPAFAIDTYVDSTLKKEVDDVPPSVIGLIGSSLFAFTYVMQRLQIYLNTPCLNGGRGAAANICTTEYFDFSQFFATHDFLSFMMILTHSIPFVLLPWVSKQISETGPIIKKDFEGFNPFLSKFLH
jgi:hypothetical protein